jgi:ABC-2 type transport system permease protein
MAEAHPLAVGPPERASARGPAHAWRGFRTAVRLGWETEANWTDPLIFFTYSVAKPVAAALMLVFMLEVISAGAGGADPRLRAFVVIGSAMWSFVVTGGAGLALSVLEDRERYRMLKYLYVSPNSLLVLLLGRGTARVAIGGFGAVITLAFGVAFLGLPFDPLAVDWPLALAAMLLGLVSVVALGVVLASIAMQTRQEAWQYPEAVAGALFLVVGAVFPLFVLPAPAQIVGLAMPQTWWLEGVRRALFPGIPTAIGGSDSVYTGWTGAALPSSGEILLALVATTAVLAALAGLVFRWSERSAREKGVFDLITGS